MATPASNSPTKGLSELRALATSRSRSQAVWRARIVLAHLEGQSYREVSERFGCSQATVAKWLFRYRAEGVRGLWDKARETRPGPRQTLLATWLPSVLARRPRHYGLSGDSWTLQALQDACAFDTGERPSLETIRRALRAIEGNKRT